jgi:2-amino-4-hydroxy-6-hydroxymethyldihydropteridine diphosphokinase
MNRASLVLGSNINPEVNIPRALGFLERSFTVIRISNTWRTKSVGFKAADYLNAAVEIETGLDVHMLKSKCLSHIEEIMGRVRQEDKNAPRTIDIDIVIFNNVVLDPKIFTEEYLAFPISELHPGLRDLKSGKTLKEISDALSINSPAICVGNILPSQ